MEVGIRFWVPNLGLNPKYGNIVQLLFTNKELLLARKLNLTKKIIVLKNKIYSKTVYISIYSQIAIYSKNKRAWGGGGLKHPFPLLPSPTLPPNKNPPVPKFTSKSDAHVETGAEIKFLYYPLYIYIYLSIYLSIYVSIYLSRYLYIFIYIYNHLVTLDMCFIMLYLKIEFTDRKQFVSLLVYIMHLNVL